MYPRFLILTLVSESNWIDSSCGLLIATTQKFQFLAFFHSDSIQFNPNAACLLQPEFGLILYSSLFYSVELRVAYCSHATIRILS